LAPAERRRPVPAVGRAFATLVVAGTISEAGADRLRRLMESYPGVASAAVSSDCRTVTVAYAPRETDVAGLLRLTVLVGTGGNGRITSVSIRACGGAPPPVAPEPGVLDVVCGMRFPEECAVAKTCFEGRAYHFCSKRCRSLFGQHPRWYVEKDVPA